jgi:molybdopterin/thiamine biosynthesis adenylyltransferase/proteasome lid subunit RPN8/RPN11
MIELLLAADDGAAIRSELIGGETENCAILYASQTVRADGLVRLLAREFQFPAATDYTRRGLLEAELSPEFVARVTKRARREGSALVFVHSHPGSEAPIFSPIDSRGEEHLSIFLAHRHPAVTHAALIISAGGVRARRLGGGEEVRVLSIGTTREVLFDPLLPAPWNSEKFDRQIRAFGSAGQEALQRLRIAIVGLGGTGSLIAQQLVHLGVRDFILVDPDVIEPTNLNRVANATPDDINHPKVEIAARYIQAIAKDATIACVKGDVIQARTARELLNADLIFGCTDSHGSRAVLQQVSYQYMIPCFDMGLTIAVSAGRITHIYGRVQLLAPGLACFTCNGLLDANEVRRDMMTAFERQADHYIQGEREPAPAVMSLNSTVASLAITMMISVVTSIPVRARHVLYNAITSTLRTVRAQPKPNCYVCSRSGAFARADSWPLFAREA